MARLMFHIQIFRYSDQDSSIRLRLRNLIHVTVFCSRNVRILVGHILYLELMHMFLSNS